MALEKATVPIQVGGGVDQYADERLLAPPAAREVENARTPAQGAYTKTGGFDTYGSATDLGDGVVVFPTKAGVGAVGSKAEAVWEGDPVQPAVTTTGVPVATRVTKHPVSYFKGWLQQPNLAHNQGFTAVCVNERFHDTPGGAATEVTHFLVLDPSWNVLVHHTFAPLYEARIEPYYDSGTGDTGFTLLGTEAVGGAGVSKLDLYSVWKAGSWALTGPHTVTASVWNTELDTVRTNRFDTHADGNTKLFAVYQHDVGARASCQFRALRLTMTPTTGAVSTELTNTLGTVSPDACAVFYDASQDTVLAYHHNQTTSLLKASGSSGTWATAFSTVTMASTPPYGTWNGNADVKGNRGLYANPALCFWRGSNGKIHLPGQTITSAASHVVTAVAMSPNYFTTVHRRPQPMNTTGGWVTVAQRGEERANTPVNALRPYSMGDSDVRVPYSTITEQIAAGILSSQRGNFFDGNGASYRCGQTALTGAGALLVPTTAPEPNQTFQKTGQMVAYASPWFDTSSVTPDFPYGRDNGEELLVVAEVEFDSGDRSYVRLGETTLVAAGSLLSCDGDLTVPAWLDRPACVYAFHQPGPATDDWDAAAAIAGGPLDAIWMGTTTAKTRQLAFVLVFTDKNGNQIRSEPYHLDTSRAADVDHTAVPVIPPADGTWDKYLIAGNYYKPPAWFELFVPPALVTAGVTAYHLKVEVYASSLYDATSAPLTEDFKLNCVSQVIQSGSPARYYFMVRNDLNGDTPAGIGPTLTDLPPLRPDDFPLYTNTDLPATRPPSTNVLASAGQYAFLVPSENPRVMWVSKPIEQGRVPEWSPLLTVNAPAGAGDIVSIAGTGDRLYMLCEHGAWELFVGSGGPDATGSGAFAAPRRIYSRDGAVGHGTTTEGVWGVFYLTSSGPKLIAPDGNQNDIGRRVLPAMDVADMATAVYRESTREVWLFGRTTGAWVYSLNSDAWTRCDLPADQSAEFGSEILRYDASSSTLLAPVDEPLDRTEPLLLKVVSPWLQLGDPLSYKRLWRVFASVRKLSGTWGTVSLKLAYDYVDSDVDVSTWAWDELAALPNPNVIMIRPSRQKFAAVRVTVEDGLQDDGSKLTNDVTWTLSSLELECGAKRGGIKLSASNKK